MFITVKGTFKNSQTHNRWQKCEIMDCVDKFRLEGIGSENSEGGIFYWAVHERQKNTLSIRISEKEHKRLKAIMNKIG